MEDNDKKFSWGKKDYSSFTTSSVPYYKDNYNKSWDNIDDYYDNYYNRSLRYYDYYSGSSFYRSERRSSMSSFMSSSYGLGRSYSKDSSLDSERVKELFDKSLKLTKEFISILNFSFPINIYVSDSIHEISTDLSTRRLFLPTKCLEEIKNKSDDEIINIVVGQGLHEAAHLKYTNARLFNPEKLASVDKLKNLLLNIIEDERVDRLLVVDRPGYSLFIESAKDYNIKIKIDDKEINSVIENLIYLIRCPKKLNKDILTKYNTIFDNIKLAIKNFPTKTSEVFDLSDKISKILVSKWSIVELDRVCSRLSNLFVPLLYGEDKDVYPWSCPSEFTLRSFVSSSSGSDLVLGIKETLGVVEKCEDQTLIIHDFNNNIREKQERYKQIRNKISKYIPMIKNKLQSVEKNTKFNIPGCRSGLLDTNKIVEAYQDVPQVYTRLGTITTNKVTVCVLIDESGSMSYSNRCGQARDAAILLYESLKELSGVDLFIYGHTADQTFTGATEIRPYIEPGNDNKLNLCEIKGRYENRDGLAILGVAKRVRKYTHDRCLMFVISDGIPAARGYYGEEAIEHTRKKIKIAESLGFDIMQITIEGDIKATKKMFGKNYIDLRKDLSFLPEKLGKLIREYVLKNKVTTISV